MRLYIIEMQGNWTHAWPSQQITFLGCSFKGDKTVSPGFFVVSIEVQAESDEDARSIGKERIEEACYFWELCLGGSVYLRQNQITIRPKGSPVAQGVVSAELSATIYSANPPTPEDLRRISDVESKIQQNPWLKRVIRWWGEGRRETDPIDGFMKFWIAFECLGRNMYETGALRKERGSWLQRICEKVSNRFSRPGWFSHVQKILVQNNKEKERKLRRLYKDRSKILHAAYWSSTDAAKRAQDMQEFLERLLQNHLQL